MPPAPPASPDRLHAIYAVLKHIGARADEVSQAERQTTKRYERQSVLSLVLIALSAIPLVLSVTPWWSPLNWTVAFGLLLTLGVLVAYLNNRWYARQQHPSLGWLHTPRADLLNMMDAQAEQEHADLHDLLVFSAAELQQVRDRLQHEVDRRQERAELLFGLVGRAGLFPGVLTAGIAFLVATQGKGVSWTGVLLVAVTFLLTWNHDTSARLQLGFSQVRALVAMLDRAITWAAAT